MFIPLKSTMPCLLGCWCCFISLHVVFGDCKYWKLETVWFIVEKFSLWSQVSSRLADLEATLDAGIRHRNKALASVGGHLEQWMDMVRVSFWMSSCLRFSCSLCCSCKAVLISDHCLHDGYIFWTNSSHPYHLFLGKKREGCVWYTEHVKFWCHKKMSCWRGMVPCICKSTGIFFSPLILVSRNLLEPY